jgi:hypothetical protein
MPRRPALGPLLLSALALAATPARGRAQAIPAVCKPLLDAQRKAIMTPHHSYSTQGLARQGDKPTTGEMISVGGENYLLYKGQWRRSPMTPQKTLAQLEENIADAKQMSCQHVGDESVGGTPAAVYTTHNESEIEKADARVWVAKGAGLVLRTEQDMDIGDGVKRHISIRYEYANIHAPAGVK